MVHEHFDGWRSGVAQAGEKLVSAACLLHTLQLGQGGIAPSSVMLFGHGDRTAASTSPHLELTALEQAGESFLHAMGASPARPRPISDATIAMAGAGGADRYPRVTDLDPRRAPDRWARGLRVEGGAPRRRSGEGLAQVGRGYALAPGGWPGATLGGRCGASKAAWPGVEKAWLQ
jgi:hypothetical protein